MIEGVDALPPEPPRETKLFPISRDATKVVLGDGVDLGKLLEKERPIFQHGNPYLNSYLFTRGLQFGKTGDRDAFMNGYNTAYGILQAQARLVFQQLPKLSYEQMQTYIRSRKEAGKQSNAEDIVNNQIEEIALQHGDKVFVNAIHTISEGMNPVEAHLFCHGASETYLPIKFAWEGEVMEKLLS